MPDVSLHDRPFPSRRLEPRISTGTTVAIRAIVPGGPAVIAVDDIGFRGFAITTSEPVVVHTRVRFEFSCSRASTFTADAVSVHCHEEMAEPHGWISGWEFPEQPGLDDAIDRLVDAAIGAVSD